MFIFVGNSMYSKQSYLSVDIPERTSPTTSTTSSGYMTNSKETFDQLKSHQERLAEVVRLLTECRDEVSFSTVCRMCCTCGMN